MDNDRWICECEEICFVWGGGDNFGILAFDHLHAQKQMQHTTAGVPTLFQLGSYF